MLILLIEKVLYDQDIDFQWMASGRVLESNGKNANDFTLNGKKAIQNYESITTNFQIMAKLPKEFLFDFQLIL